MDGSELNASKFWGKKVKVQVMYVGNSTLQVDIGVGARSTLGGRHFCPKNMYEKNNKMPEFYVILGRKISKIP